MGKGRFLYNNLITAESMLTLSSWRTGMVTAALKNGSGSATLSPSGAYSGQSDKEYIVEIDSVSGGAEIGQATFRWSDGSGSWNATGVLTSSSNILLSDGVYVKWTAGTGSDFVSGDIWYFKGINPFPVSGLLDLDRDHRYRSSGLDSPNSAIIDLGSPQEVKALILHDHNISSGATITLKANTTNSWGSPAFSESVTWNAEKILHYLSAAQTYQYWKPEIDDPVNPDGYIEIGEFFLGSYLELSQNFVNGYSRDASFLYNQSKTTYGVKRHRYFNTERPLLYDYSLIPKADLAALEAMHATLGNRSTGLLKPIWFNEDSDYPANQWLVWLYGMPHKHNVRDYYDCSLVMEEVLKSV